MAKFKFFDEVSEMNQIIESNDIRGMHILNNVISVLNQDGIIFHTREMIPINEV